MMTGCTACQIFGRRRDARDTEKCHECGRMLGWDDPSSLLMPEDATPAWPTPSIQRMVSADVEIPIWLSLAEEPTMRDLRVERATTKTMRRPARLQLVTEDDDDLPDYSDLAALEEEEIGFELAIAFEESTKAATPRSLRRSPKDVRPATISRITRAHT